MVEEVPKPKHPWMSEDELRNNIADFRAWMYGRLREIEGSTRPEDESRRQRIERDLARVDAIAKRFGLE